MLFPAAEVTRVFFSSTLLPAHTFLILILQTASYTHTCWLTLISGGCGVLRSTRALHTMLKRPGTRSNKLGPDPDPTDHLKYRPEPVRVPGPRVSGPPWRPLVRGPNTLQPRPRDRIEVKRIFPQQLRNKPAPRPSRKQCVPRLRLKTAGVRHAEEFKMWASVERFHRSGMKL